MPTSWRRPRRAAQQWWTRFTIGSSETRSAWGLIPRAGSRPEMSFLRGEFEFLKAAIAVLQHGSDLERVFGAASHEVVRNAERGGLAWQGHLERAFLFFVLEGDHVRHRVLYRLPAYPGALRRNIAAILLRAGDGRRIRDGRVQGCLSLELLAADLGALEAVDTRRKVLLQSAVVQQRLGRFEIEGANADLGVRRLEVHDD